MECVSGWSVEALIMSIILYIHIEVHTAAGSGGNIVW